jgi:serine/threonine protein kinase
VESPENVLDFDDVPPPRQRKPGDEPLPGYRLIQPLGRGSFGEVWKCEAPGGLGKAIKFVAGSQGPLDSSMSLATQELAALQRIKDIRHPFLLSTERVEVVNGELMIVMELADRNLQNVLEERRAAGLPGIPREELFGYLLEAAEALDVMNFQHGLQHLDIKPHNLFLVSNHVKVADFGLVTSLGQGSGNGLGGTPLYSAPEILRGQVSRHSDQYSLAIVYQELLSGTVPFRGANIRQLMFQHLTAQPSLGALPAEDQPLVARALVKDPDQRYSSCLTFVHALIDGQEPAPVADDVDHSPSNGEALAPRRLRAVRSVSTPGTVKETPPPVCASARDTPTSCMPRVALEGERVPGYTLLECESRGQLIDVWRARGQDGQERLVHLLSSVAHWREQEIAQLMSRLWDLEHPTLAPREILRATSGCVVVVTPAFTRSLGDRLQECLGQQLRGIPRDELLGYLKGVAEALASLYKKHQVAHLGLSPRCLWLADGKAWLGDFGLVQLVWQAAGQSAGRLNERYAAPELLNGRGGPASDQYSLAVIYAELLSGVSPRRTRYGVRPSSGRASARVDLDLVSAADRAVLARALHPDPERRYSSATELIDALLGADNQAQERACQAAHLPSVIPYRSLLGYMAPPGTVLPPLGMLVRELMAADATLPRVHEHGDFRYRQLEDDILEARFAVRLWPGMMKLRMETIRQQWQAQVVQKADEAFVLEIPFPVSFFQRCAGKKAGLQIQVQVAPPCGPDGQRSLALARIRPLGGGDQMFDRIMKMGPAILQSVRVHLQAQPELRKHERFAYRQRVRVFPVLPALELGEVIEGETFDISEGGVGCTLPKAPPDKRAFLHFDQVPRLATYAILARIAWSRQGAQGGWQIGVTFGVE